MTLTMQKARNPRFYAGLYMRTKKKVRFWGWGRPEFRSTPVTKVERPWAALADWLRAAHSLAGTDRQNTLSENTLRSTESSVDAPVVEQQSATPPALRPKRKLRFVCDRNFIGLAYR